MIINFFNKKREKELNNLQTFERSSKQEHDTALSTGYTQLSVKEVAEFFTPVEAPILIDVDGDTRPIEGRKAIVNPENGEVLSIVSDRYKVVTNQEVFNAFDTALSESNIDLTGAYKTIYQMGKGGKTFLNYSFPAYETPITDRVVGDTVRLSCGAINGYDGQTMFSTTFDSVRLVCTNSMVTADPIAFYAGKHTQSLVVETAIEKIKRAIDVYCDHAELYKRWADTPISELAGNVVLEKLVKAHCKGRKLSDDSKAKLLLDYQRQWEREVEVLGRNRWSLYNALTHMSTHRQVRTRGDNMNAQKSAQLNREQELRKFMANNTNWFSEAA